jgi:hypothetical protein
MTKKAFLHLGFHKTASTYLQIMIDLNRNDSLSKFHVVNRIGNDSLNLKRALFHYWVNSNEQMREGVVAEFAQIVKNFEASKKDCLLLSDEALIGPQLRQMGETGFYSKLEQQVAVLTECLSAYELHFLFYVRDSSAWLRSLYNQSVKQIRFAGSFEAYLHQVATDDIWGILYRRLRAAAQDREVRFFVLEDDTDSPFGTGNSLFNYLGLSEGDRMRMVKPQGRANESLSESSLDFMRKLNASSIDRDALAIVRKIVRTNPTLFR